jgi:hypothetical protein
MGFDRSSGPLAEKLKQAHLSTWQLEDLLGALSQMRVPGIDGTVHLIRLPPYLINALTEQRPQPPLARAYGTEITQWKQYLEALLANPEAKFNDASQQMT